MNKTDKFDNNILNMITHIIKKATPITQSGLKTTKPYLFHFTNQTL